MKRFMYGSIGLLCLALAFHLGAMTAGSSYIDFGGSNLVAVSLQAGSHPRVLDVNGVLWEVDELAGWQLDELAYPLPVPLSNIKYFESEALVTWDDHVWRRPGGGPWYDCGAWPGAAATEKTSWGQLKAKYRDREQPN